MVWWCLNMFDTQTRRITGPVWLLCVGCCNSQWQGAIRSESGDLKSISWLRLFGSHPILFWAPKQTVCWSQNRCVASVSHFLEPQQVHKHLQSLSPFKIWPTFFLIFKPFSSSKRRWVIKGDLLDPQANGASAGHPTAGRQTSSRTAAPGA